MSNVIVKENETLDSALRRFKQEMWQKLAFSRRDFVKKNTMKKPSVRR